MTHGVPTSRLQERDPLANEPVSDAQLMEALKFGDKLAFSQLYDRYAGTVYGVCLRVLHHQVEAEAVVSDVFWELWRKPEGFNRLKGSCNSYLLTLARSRAIDRLRASATRVQKTQCAMQEAAGEVDRIQESHNPCEEVLADERRQAVREAVGRLEREQREALLLAYFGGLTHREISQQLEMPLGTVKTHIRRGLQSLKAELKSLGGHDGL